jgi:hypothetical protein
MSPTHVEHCDHAACDHVGCECVCHRFKPRALPHHLGRTLVLAAVAWLALTAVIWTAFYAINLVMTR